MQRTEVLVEAVLLGPPQSGKAYLVGRMLVAFDAVHPRVVSRLMSHGNVFLQLHDRLHELVRLSERERRRGVTMTTTRYRINTKRYPLSLVSVPSLANYPHACIHTASLTDYALLVVPAVGEEFAACMSNRGKASLFESALLARGLGMEQLIVVLAKADAVVSELAHGWDTEAHEALIASREKQVVNLLLRMRFQRQNIHVVVTSAWEDKGFVSPFFAKGLSMADALENIRREELPLYKTRQQQKDQPAAPFRQALLRVKRRPGCCPAPYGRVLSGHFRPRQDLAYYPRTRESRLGIWNGAAPIISTEGAESFNETLVSASAGSCLCVFATKTPATRFLHSGMVAMHAREDAGTMLELTVTEFTVSVRAINPVSAKGRRVLTVGQDVAVHSHGARVGCKVMAILSVKRGQNVVRGALREVCAGEVAEVRLRPLAGFVVEPFDVCTHLGRVLIRDTVTLAFGKVVRVARRYKSTFLDLLRNLEALRAAVEKEPPCLLGRDEHNNTLLHLLIGGRHEGVGMVVQQVEGRFGRVAAQKLMRVRNTRGETAIHLALVCGWFEVAALLLSLGAPLVPSKEEQARLSKLWKKPIPSPIDILDRRFCRAHASRAVAQAEERRSRSTTHAAGIQRSPLNLALLCLIVLTRDRDDFTNLEDMLPTQAMQELFAIALCSLSSRQ